MVVLQFVNDERDNRQWIRFFVDFLVAASCAWFLERFGFLDHLV